MPSLRKTGSHASELDYGLTHNFSVEIDGVISAGFQEVSGLSKEIEVVEYRNGDSPTIHYRPGRTKVGRVTLRRGQLKDQTLHAWFKRVEAGETDRRSVSVIQKDRVRGEVTRYNLFECWPCAWKAPDLNAKGEGHLVEEITFIAERLEMGA